MTAGIAPSNPSRAIYYYTHLSGGMKSEHAMSTHGTSVDYTGKDSTPGRRRTGIDDRL